MEPRRGAEGCQARRPTAQHTAGPPLSNARTASNRAGAHHRRTQRRALTLRSTQKVRMHSQRITPTTGSTPTTQTTPATDAPLPSYRRTAAKPQPNPATRQRPLYNILSRTGRSLPSSFRSSVGQLVVAVVAVADVRVTVVPWSLVLVQKSPGSLGKIVPVRLTIVIV